MAPDLAAIVERITGARPEAVVPLHGGCVSDVVRVELEGGKSVVAKLDETGACDLTAEAFHLRYLAEKTDLPVPGVLHAEDRILIIEHIPHGGRLNAAAQEHAAELLAALHGVTHSACGFEIGTTSKHLTKPTPWTDSWIEFFREHRLAHSTRASIRNGRLPNDLAARVEKLTANIERWLIEPEKPALIHGDMWTGNVLVRENRVAAFVDPSCYYAHPEQELAYSTLFGTFETPFFRRYAEIRPIDDGFFEERIHLYNLYHLMIHVHHFGGPYVGAVADTVRFYGY